MRSARKQDVAVNVLGMALLAGGGAGIFGQFGGIPLLLLMFVFFLAGLSAVALAPLY